MKKKQETAAKQTIHKNKRTRDGGCRRTTGKNIAREQSNESSAREGGCRKNTTSKQRVQSENSESERSETSFLKIQKEKLMARTEIRNTGEGVGEEGTTFRRIKKIQIHK